jgi:hypothetical protein
MRDCFPISKKSHDVFCFHAKSAPTPGGEGKS